MTDTIRVTVDQFNSIRANDNGTGTPADSWTPINLNQLPDQPPVQPTLGGLGLLYPGKRHVFSGPPESAKTLAAYLAGLAIVREGHEIIVIDFEMGPYDTRGRLRDLGATPDELDRVLYIEPETPPGPEHINRLLIIRPALVIIDAAAGAYSIAGLDDNKRGEVEAFSTIYVKQFWKAGIATLLLDHVVKNNDNRGAFQIGSERKLGGTDVHLGFNTLLPISRGTTGKYKITTHKDRGGYLKRGHLADLELQSNPETHRIAWTLSYQETHDQTEPFRPTHLMEKISRHLEPLTVELSKSEIARQVRGDTNAKFVAMERLVAEGYCQLTEGPRQSNLLKSVRAYREDDDEYTHPSTPIDPYATPMEEGSSRPPYSDRDDPSERGGRRNRGRDAPYATPNTSTPMEPDADIPF